MSGIRVNSNIQSLGAQRQLADTTAVLAKTYERLSTGQRVNKASDDAAGLAIASTLDANARVYTQAHRNLNDGVSYCSVAHGAIEQLKSILLRQRELSTQAANGTYTNAQRDPLDKELQALSQEYNRILETTVFNGRPVFSRETGALSLQCGYGSGALLSGSFESSRAQGQDDIQRVNVSSGGAQGAGENAIFGSLSLSVDGRYAVFATADSTLVSGDTNGVEDIFIRDRLTQETRRLSVNSSGIQGNGQSMNPYITPDGRYVAFDSSASNLVSDDTNGQRDIFLYDMVTNELKRANVSSSGAQATGGFSSAANVTPDGRYVVFNSAATNLVTGDINGQQDVFVHDMITGQTQRASVSTSGTEGSGQSQEGVISADGRYVAFVSSANNLVAGDSGQWDIFVRDLVLDTTTRVSLNTAGGQANASSGTCSISSDGRYVQYRSNASNLVTGDTNGVMDMFVYDRTAGTTTRVSVSSSGTQSNGSSDNGWMSSDGHYVLFDSSATNLVASDGNGQKDVFVHDMLTGETALVSTSSSGTQGNGISAFPQMASADGRYIVFQSNASNLVSSDTNGKYDYFITGNPLADWSQVSRSQWLSVRTQADALSSQDAIDSYLDELNAAEGQIGAFLSRVDTASSNLSSMTENIRAAESRIMDADIAEESATLVRSEILQQVGQSVLAQANQQPQVALQLLSTIGPG